MKFISSIIYEVSFLEVVGVVPALLSLGAILLGVASLIRRQRATNLAIAIWLLGIACAGAGITAWRIFDISFPFRPGTNMAVDVLQWYANFGIAWLPIGIVLPGCSIGFAFVGMSALMLRDRALQRADHKNMSAEQAGASDGDKPPS